MTNTQASNKYRLLVAGTFAAIVVANSAFEEEQIVPNENYDIDLAGKKHEIVNISLMHETLQRDLDNTAAEADIVEMPVLRKIRVRITQVIPMEFTSIEDEEGFI